MRMNIDLIQGSFSSADAKEIVSDMVQVKIKYHQNKITKECTEEEIKYRENRIKKLQNQLAEFKKMAAAKSTIKLEVSITQEE